MKMQLRSGRFLKLFLGILLLVLPFVSSLAEQSTPDSVSGASPYGKDMPAIANDIAPIAMGKHILIAYFSQESSAKRIAEDLGTILKADVERIIEKTVRRGFLGFLGAGADSASRKSTPIETPVRDPSTYDLVIVLTPVWAGHVSPPVRTWLSMMRGHLPDCAFGEVSAFTRPEKIAKEMELVSGKAPVAIVGFVQKDFDAGKRNTYISKMEAFVSALR